MILLEYSLFHNHLTLKHQYLVFIFIVNLYCLVVSGERYRTIMVLLSPFPTMYSTLSKTEIIIFTTFEFSRFKRLIVW